MITFKEYLILESQYDNIVIEPNDGRGIGVVVYGYKRNNDGVERTLLNDFQTLADAKQEYPTASVTASEEETEARLPAVKDTDMMAKGDRDRTPRNHGSVRSNKRNAQIAGRKQRSRLGKGTGGRNYLDNLFGKGGRPEDYD